MQFVRNSDESSKHSWVRGFGSVFAALSRLLFLSTLRPIASGSVPPESGGSSGWPFRYPIFDVRSLIFALLFATQRKTGIGVTRRKQTSESIPVRNKSRDSAIRPCASSLRGCSVSQARFSRKARDALAPFQRKSARALLDNRATALPLRFLFVGSGISGNSSSVAHFANGRDEAIHDTPTAGVFTHSESDWLDGQVTSERAHFILPQSSASEGLVEGGVRSAAGWGLRAARK